MIGSDILSRDSLYFFICPFIIVYLHYFGSIFFNKVLPARIEHGQVKINVEHLSKFAKCFGTSFFELIPFKMLLQKELLEDAERFTGSSADGSALTGPSPCDIYKKQNNTPKGVIFIWRRTWDSNPRGCYTLLDFQSSSLATRSILQVCAAQRHLYYYSISGPALQAKFRQSCIFSFKKAVFFFTVFCSLLFQAFHSVFTLYE